MLSRVLKIDKWGQIRYTFTMPMLTVPASAAPAGASVALHAAEMLPAVKLQNEAAMAAVLLQPTVSFVLSAVALQAIVAAVSLPGAVAFPAAAAAMSAIRVWVVEAALSKVRYCTVGYHQE